MSLLETIQHDQVGRQLMADGLSSAKNGDWDTAIDELCRAAVEFEKNQEYRIIPGVWETIGRLLARKLKLEIGGPSDEIDYRVIPIDVWRTHDDKMRLAWVYQWAAEHRERGGDFDTAFQLYLKAGEYAEQTEEATQKNPRWPAKMYYRAVLNFVKAFGHTADEHIEHALDKMHDHNMRLKTEHHDGVRAYKSLAISYCSIKSALILAGNLLEARVVEQRELKAAMKLHRARKSYGNMIYHWLRAGGFVWFIGIWSILVVAGFPLLYFLFDLISKQGVAPDWTDAVQYSIETSLIIGHDDFHAATQAGRFLAIAETALSYFGLGSTLWYMTKKLE